MSDRPTIELSWVQAAAGALAAVSSAVLLSTVGVAGTIVGAAVGSVVATVAGAVYTYSLAVSRERLRSARDAARERVVRAREARLAQEPSPPELAGVEAALERAELAHAEDELAAATPAPRPSWREALGAIRWGRVLLASAGVFVVAVAAVVAFELAAGRAVSSYTGGSDADTGPATSVPFVDGAGTARQEPADAPTDAGTPTGGTTPDDEATGTPDASSGDADRTADDEPTSGDGSGGSGGTGGDGGSDGSGESGGGATADEDAPTSAPDVEEPLVPTAEPAPTSAP